LAHKSASSAIRANDTTKIATSPFFLHPRDPPHGDDDARRWSLPAVDHVVVDGYSTLLYII
jgi:hypothetical protein